MKMGTQPKQKLAAPLNEVLQYGVNLARVRQLAATLRRRKEPAIQRKFPGWGDTTVLADGTYIY